MKKQILLIDDDVDELLILKEAIKETQSGFECKFANSFEEGINILQNSHPDYIFLDINMPRIDGFEALAAIRRMKDSGNIPVILYSTAINEDLTRKAVSLGAQGCVKKTDSIERLTGILNRLSYSIPPGNYYTVNC